MHTIKPIDKDAIKEACENSKLIVSVEEHNIFGGLGSAISEQMVLLKSHPKLLTIGVKDYYSKGGNYEFLKEKHGLSTDKIVMSVLEKFKKFVNGK